MCFLRNFGSFVYSVSEEKFFLEINQSYGRWIYNYLCNQYLSPLKMRVRIPLMARCRVHWRGVKYTMSRLDLREYNYRSYNIMWWSFSVTGLWFSPGTPVSSTNKIYHHNITEILLKVVLNTINQTNKNIKQIKITCVLQINFLKQRCLKICQKWTDL